MLSKEPAIWFIAQVFASQKMRLVELTMPSTPEVDSVVCYKHSGSVP